MTIFKNKQPTIIIRSMSAVLLMQGLPGQDGPPGLQGIPGCNGTKVGLAPLETYDFPN